jgi:hypothetical protein
MPLAAPVRTAAARSTLELPFNVPAKDWFPLREAASICGMSETFMEQLFDAGEKISGHKHNARDGRRWTKRIPRVWLVSYLVRTAEYDDPALVDALVGCLRFCSREQQKRVHASLGQFLSS